MALRRMFSKKIIDTDAFLDMPTSSQLLYFHLAMHADDDGFVSSPKKIGKTIGSSDDDFKVLIGKRFVLVFESGVLVIKHWKIHNYIQSDRYTATTYIKELNSLGINEFGAYTELNTKCIHDVSKEYPQVRLGKVSIGKDNIYSAEFEKIWSKYPKRVGKKMAEKHFNASVKNKEDLDRLEKALSNYLSSKRVSNGFIQNGDTFMNNWEDWVDYKEETCKKCNDKGSFISTTGYSIICECPAGKRK